MSDWEDFCNSQEIEFNDPYAINKVQNSRISMGNNTKAEEDYLNGIAKGKMTKKHHGKMKKVGFNNFKPFGKKMQNYSKKPITLVYGPNSIGKSSFIHINAYIRYILESQKLDLTSTSMFGDEINLGGFGKFIHKRDKEKILKINFEIEDCKEAIIEYLNIEEYDPFIIETLSLYNLDDIENIIKSSEEHIFKKLEKIDIKNFKEIKDSKYYKSFEKNTSNKLKTNSEFISKLLVPIFIKKAKKDFHKEIFLKHIFDKYELKGEELKYFINIVYSYIREIIEENKYLNQIKKEKIFLNIIVEISNISSNILINKVSYYLNNELYEEVEKGDQGEVKFLNDVLMSHYINLSNDRNIFHPLFNNIGKPLFDKIYNYSDDFDRVKNIKNKLHEEKNSSILFCSFHEGYERLIGAFNDLIGFNKMQYIGPLRFYPERDFSFKDLDSQANNIVDSQTSWSYLKDADLRNTINKWIKDTSKLKTPYEIKYRKLYDMKMAIKKLKGLKYTDILKKYLNIKEEDLLEEDKKSNPEDEFNINNFIKKEKVNKEDIFVDVLKKLIDIPDSKEELVFEDLRNGTQISNRDLGLGISQILPILIATNHQKNTTIAIEQPELHLHPAVQCEIADEFIRSYNENGNEFILETHSEHLLLRIMKRLRHTSEGRISKDNPLYLTPKDICLLYVDSNSKTTYIKELELDNDGTLLDSWPNGFFEEGYKERFE